MTVFITQGKFWQTLWFKRLMLLLFVLLQAAAAAIYLAFEYRRIEENIATSLKNTAVLQARAFNMIGKLVDQQISHIGERYFHAKSATPEFLAAEVRKEWLDAVIVLDVNGKIVAQASILPLDDIFPAGTLKSHSLASSEKYQELRAKDADKDSFFVIRKNVPRLDGGGVVFYRAIRDGNGVFEGSVIGLFSNRTLEGMFEESQRAGFALGSEGSMVLIDQMKHKVLYFSRDIALVQPGDDYKPQQLESTDYGESIKKYVSPLDGEHRMASLQLLNQGRWVLLMGMASDDYLHSWRIQVGISVAAFLLMATLQWLVLNLIHQAHLQRDKLKFDSLHDPLTGLSNRRHFDEWSSNALSPSMRYMQPLTLLALDLDHFKRVNDSYGHDAGDAVLISVAEVLREQLRECDLPARFGGEEFVVALPQTPIEGALLVAERIRAAIQSLNIRVAGKTLRCTVSIGVALVRGREVDSALKESDLALYRAKEAGRNCVISLEEDASQIAPAEAQAAETDVKVE
ncbi:diguanylate cyclase [Chitinibacter sp. S2-10]|uniref:sensor domain-containing diguanylate cyclase n=1 Tax=Chitinibacter sp. S2-10 TaxID=3373597 RepID=UPI0039776A04